MRLLNVREHQLFYLLLTLNVLRHVLKRRNFFGLKLRKEISKQHRALVAGQKRKRRNNGGSVSRAVIRTLNLRHKLVPVVHKARAENT